MRRSFSTASSSSSFDRDRSRSNSPGGGGGGASVQKKVNYDEAVVVLSSKPPEVLAGADRGRLRQGGDLHLVEPSQIQTPQNIVQIF